MESDRGQWYLLTALILGLSLGLLYSWAIAPTTQEDTHPASLREDYKDVYRSLISRAYQANQNLPRAKARLELLGDEEPALALAAQAQRSLAERGDQEMARLLANLSSALRQTPQAAPEDGLTTTPVPPGESGQGGEQATSATSTPRPEQTETAASPLTETPRPQSSPTPTATDAPPFILQEDFSICDPNLEDPLIKVFATNADGEGIPGVELIVTWSPDNQERFYTGLKPDLGQGYADFEVEPRTAYTVELAGSQTLVSDLEIQPCETEDGESFWGSWEIYITHPN